MAERAPALSAKRGTFSQVQSCGDKPAALLSFGPESGGRDIKKTGALKVPVFIKIR